MFRSPFSTISKYTVEYENVFTTDGATVIIEQESLVSEVKSIKLKQLTSLSVDVSNQIINMLHHVAYGIYLICLVSVINTGNYAFCST